jgi:hypothetical protein
VKEINSSIRLGPAPPHKKRLGISDLAVPASWPSTLNRHVATAHEATKALALRFKLITPLQLRKFDESAFARLSGYVCPDAPVDRLKVFNDWHSWLFFFDDQADEELYRSALSLEEYMQECLALLRTGRMRSCPTGLELLTQDIRSRMLLCASEAWLNRFADDVSDYLFKGTLKAVENWTNQTVPDVESYLIQRRYDSSVLTCEDLIEITGEALELSDEVFANPTIQRLRELCANVVAYTNDIFSYEKEVLIHKNPNNLLHVLMVHQSLSLEDATTRAVSLINEDIQAFIVEEQTFWPHAKRDRRLSAYVRGLKAWMRGNLLWSLETGRYASPTSPFPELRSTVRSGFRA